MLHDAAGIGGQLRVPVTISQPSQGSMIAVPQTPVAVASTRASGSVGSRSASLRSSTV